MKLSEKIQCKALLRKLCTDWGQSGRCDNTSCSGCPILTLITHIDTTTKS